MKEWPISDSQQDKQMNTIYAPMYLARYEIKTSSNRLSVLKVLISGANSNYTGRLGIGKITGGLYMQTETQRQNTNFIWVWKCKVLIKRRLMAFSNHFVYVRRCYYIENCSQSTKRLGNVASFLSKPLPSHGYKELSDVVWYPTIHFPDQLRPQIILDPKMQSSMTRSQYLELIAGRFVDQMEYNSTACQNIISVVWATERRERRTSFLISLEEEFWNLCVLYKNAVGDRNWPSLVNLIYACFMRRVIASFSLQIQGSRPWI